MDDFPFSISFFVPEIWPAICATFPTTVGSEFHRQQTPPGPGTPDPDYPDPRPPKPIAYELRRHAGKHGRDFSREAIREVAATVGAPEAEVQGAQTYYPEFQALPELKVCTGISCALSGSEGLISLLVKRGIPHGRIPCAARCDQGPALVSGDGEIFLGEEVLAFASGKGPRSWRAAVYPQVSSLVKDPWLVRRLLREGAPDLEKARAMGAYEAYLELRKRNLQQLLEIFARADIRDRKRPAEPLARRWGRAAAEPAEQRFVVAHGDPGNPGSSGGRVLMEHDPHAIIEGMALCGRMIGATEGVIFVPRSHREALARIEKAVAEQAAANCLAGNEFDLTVIAGFGAYVAGEETAIFNAIEGIRGEVRTRPPEPEVRGLFRRPTVIDHVETFAALPEILRRAPDRDPGTRLMTMGAGFQRAGLVEVGSEIILRDAIEAAGSGEDLEAVILGGPLGSLLLPEDWDVPLDPAALAERGISPGNWSLAPIRRGSDVTAIVEQLLDFAIRESCGKCVPCRLGPLAARNLVRYRRGIRQFEKILRLMGQGSLCSFGQQFPGPVAGMLKHFGDRIFPA